MMTLFLLTILSGDADVWLSRCLNYHDPAGNWARFNQTLNLEESRPDGTVRKVTITLDLPGERFVYQAEIHGNQIYRAMEKEQITIRYNGNQDVPDEAVQKYRLSKERVPFYRNYYAYLYGLPAKIKDPGASLDPVVTETEFNGQKVIALKVTYRPDVGKDTWYFYLDPTTAALRGCRFVRAEGDDRPDEYIVFEGEYLLGQMRIPQKRTWYTDPDDGLLGTDKLVGHQTP